MAPASASPFKIAPDQSPGNAPKPSAPPADKIPSESPFSVVPQERSAKAAPPTNPFGPPDSTPAPSPFAASAPPAQGAPKPAASPFGPPNPAPPAEPASTPEPAAAETDPSIAKVEVPASSEVQPFQSPFAPTAPRLAEEPAASAPSPPPVPAPDSDPAELPRDDEAMVALGLAALLNAVPESALGFDPKKVPGHVTTNIPLNVIKPQLAKGKIEVPLGLVADGCEERFQPAFTRADRSTGVKLPMQEVFHNLPAGTLAPASKEPKASPSVFETPFSKQAEEDAAANPFPVAAASEPEEKAASAAPSPFGFPPPAPEAPKEEEASAPFAFNGRQSRDSEPPSPSGSPDPGAPTDEVPPTEEEDETPFNPFAAPAPKPSTPSGFGKSLFPESKSDSTAGEFSPFGAPTSPKPAGPGKTFATGPASPFGLPKEAEAAPEPESIEEPPVETAPQPSFQPSKSLSPLPGTGRGFRLTAPDLATPPEGLSSSDLLEDLDDLEALPDPTAEKAASDEPSGPFPTEPDEDLTFGYADDAPGQLALRAVFATDEPISPQRAVALSAELPGIAACVFLDCTDGDALVAGDLDDKASEALRNAPDLYKNVRGLATMMGVGEDATTFTIRTGGGVLSFFTEGKTCLGVVHASGGFQAGVREKLTLVGRELATMTAEGHVS